MNINRLLFVAIVSCSATGCAEMGNTLKAAETGAIRGASDAALQSIEGKPAPMPQIVAQGVQEKCQQPTIIYLVGQPATVAAPSPIVPDPPKAPLVSESAHIGNRVIRVNLGY